MKMKHSLIAIFGGAASIAMVAPAIAGDAVPYGRAQVEIASYSNQQEATGCTDQSTASGEGGCDGIALRDRAMGRFGVKASEDLGNGMKGLAKFEFMADTANGGYVQGREAIVGLKMKAATIELGNVKSAYKYTGGVKYDPFVATTLEARRDNGGMSHTAWGQGGFLDRHIAVKGKAGPIKYWVTLGIGEGDGSMSGSVMYSQGAVEAFVAMVDRGDRSANEYSATKIGGAYKMGGTKIKLQYEMTDDQDANGGEPTYTFVGVEHKMGKNIIVAQLGSKDADDATSGHVDTDYLGLGVIHKFTKMTRVFAGIRTSDADDDSDEDVISVGMRKDF